LLLEQKNTDINNIYLKIGKVKLKLSLCLTTPWRHIGGVKV